MAAPEMNKNGWILLLNTLYSIQFQLINIPQMQNINQKARFRLVGRK